MSVAALRSKIRALEEADAVPVPITPTPAPPAQAKEEYLWSESRTNEVEAAVVAAEAEAALVAAHVSERNKTLAARVAAIHTKKADLLCRLEEAGVNSDMLRTLTTPTVLEDIPDAADNRVIWNLSDFSGVALRRRHQHNLTQRMRATQRTLEEYSAVNVRELSCSRNEQRIRSVEEGFATLARETQIEDEQERWVSIRRGEVQQLAESYTKERDKANRENNALLLQEGKLQHAVIQSRLERPQVGLPVTGIPCEEFEETSPLPETVVAEHPVPENPPACVTEVHMSIHDIGRDHKHRALKLTNVRNCLEKQAAAWTTLSVQVQTIHEELKQRSQRAQEVLLYLLKNRETGRKGMLSNTAKQRTLHSTADSSPPADAEVSSDEDEKDE